MNYKRLSNKYKPKKILTLVIGEAHPLMERNIFTKYLINTNLLEMLLMTQAFLQQFSTIILADDLMTQKNINNF